MRRFLAVCKLICAVLGIFLGIVALLFVVATIRALAVEDIDNQDNEFEGGGLEELPESYLAGLPELFAQSLKIPTISTNPGDYDKEQMLAFHQFLRDKFPDVFSSSFIEVEVINTHSLLFTIKGSDETIQPYLLAAHMDVVPVYESKWKHPPFGGQIIPDPKTGEKFIWGRGAIDFKFGVMGIVMALQYLAKTGFQPRRSFYVGFGHDEEVYGHDGARHIGKELERRGVTLDFLVDEGTPLVDGVIKGMDIPVAAIGVTEKGNMRLRLDVEGEGGHSSIPPKKQVVTRLAKAIYNLGRYPQPAMFGNELDSDMFYMLASKASWPYKLLFANLWLFKPMVAVAMSRSRETNALIRTTTAPTIVKVGVKENVVPSSGYAIVNHRVHPGQSLEEVVQHDINVINDPQVKVTVDWQRAPHPVSSYGPDVPVWRLLTATVKHVFPTAITVPGMLVGNTDTMYYLNLTSRVYRMYPLLLNEEDIALIHGTDERLSVTNLQRAVRFYHRLILLADQDESTIANH